MDALELRREMLQQLGIAGACEGRGAVRSGQVRPGVLSSAQVKLKVK